MSDRKSVILAAMLRVKEEDFTLSGKPDVKALNSILEEEGGDPATAKERDEYWAEFVEMSAQDPAVIAATTIEGTLSDDTAADAEPAEPGYVNVTVTSSASDPVRLYVFGVGNFVLPVGKAMSAPIEALDALSNSDVVFETGGAA